MTPDERTNLTHRISKLEPIEREYYVDSTETDDHPEHFHSWCFAHADMVARVEALTVGAEMFATSAWTESDSAARCEWYGCDVALKAGGLTDYGVDTALGLTEEDPLAVHVYPAELVLASNAMRDDDPRWATWEHHAKKLLKRVRS